MSDSFFLYRWCAFIEVRSGWCNDLKLIKSFFFYKTIIKKTEKSCHFPWVTPTGWAPNRGSSCTSAQNRSWDCSLQNNTCKIARLSWRAGARMTAAGLGATQAPVSTAILAALQVPSQLHIRLETLVCPLPLQGQPCPCTCASVWGFT